MIKVSIIIPHFNSFESLKTLIKSIPEREELEIIIVDDRSEEDIQKKLRNFVLEERKVKLFFNEKGMKSAGTCRNIGIDKSVGEWLLFADADDFFLENMFEKIEKALKKINDRVEIIYFFPKSLNIKTNKSSYREIKLVEIMNNYLKEKNYKNELKLRYCTYVPWSKLVKKSLVNKYNIKFDEIIVSNDIMFSTKIGRYAWEIAISNEEIYCVTKNDRSLTSIRDFMKFDMRIDTFIRYYNYLSEEERKEIEISPLPLLFEGRYYGVKNFFFILRKLKQNKIKIFSYFKLEMYRIKILMYKLSKK